MNTVKLKRKCLVCEQPLIVSTKMGLKEREERRTCSPLNGDKIMAKKTSKRDIHEECRNDLKQWQYLSFTVKSRLIARIKYEKDNAVHNYVVLWCIIIGLIFIMIFT